MNQSDRSPAPTAQPAQPAGTAPKAGKNLEETNDKPGSDNGDREGEDEGGAPIEGDDSHLKDDQKPID